MTVTAARSVLPPRLDQLLSRLHTQTRHSVVVLGWSRLCAHGEHQFEAWIEGVWQSRALRLLLCKACETVEVRDVSLDRIAGVSSGRLPLKHRDLLLGWYTGNARNSRLHL